MGGAVQYWSGVTICGILKGRKQYLQLSIEMATDGTINLGSCIATVVTTNVL